MHFYKEGSFNHRLINADKSGRNVKVELQEYLPRWLRPYVHQLRVIARDQETDKVFEMKLEDHQIELKYD